MSRKWSYAIAPAMLLFSLLGCGGGNGDPVTGVSASNLKYTGALSAVNLTLTGNALDNPVKVSANKTSCTVFAATSATSRAAQCILSLPTTRKVDIVVTSNSDYVLYTTTLTAPAPQVTLKTTLGDVVMELDSVAAPITVKNFLSYVSQNPSFYKDTLFHRVIGLSPAIALESQNGLQNVRGSVAMARTSAADSATAQFFVNLVDNAFLNYSSSSSPGYAVFGKVISGMDVIDSMATKTTQTVGSNQNVPVTDITITSATQTQ
jgi:cyclophilin family peptidyl-prolyl cis-trans isomerase